MNPDKDWVENLICCIQNRPALYDKSVREYLDKNAKSKLWEEVCGVVVTDWDNLNPEEKEVKGKEIQTRWRNLRTCFKREINEQKRDKTKLAPKKRRKYLYYQQLLFLLPCIEDREPSGECSKAEDVGPEENAADFVDDFQSDAEFVQRRTVSKQSSSFFEDPFAGEPVFNIVNEIDENRFFLFSLIPLLKKMSDDHQLEVRTEFLKVLRRVLKMASHRRPRDDDNSSKSESSAPLRFASVFTAEHKTDDDNDSITIKTEPEFFEPNLDDDQENENVISGMSQGTTLDAPPLKRKKEDVFSISTKKETESYLERHVDEDEIETFGKSVTAQMRKLPEKYAIEAMAEIQTVLSQKRLQYLAETKKCHEPS